VSLAADYKGERVALLEGRKHAAWYMNGMRGAAALRRQAGQIKTLEELAALCCRVIETVEVDGYPLSPLVKYYKLSRREMENSKQRILF
jgi:hypothetical protein